jgi:hypothetical protein
MPRLLPDTSTRTPQVADTADSAARTPRICMATTRGLSRKAFRCGLYEAQDVLRKTDAVEMIQLEPGKHFPFLERRQKHLLYHDFTRTVANFNPGLRRVQLTREYDLFVAVCQNFWDLLYLNAIDGWKDRCRASVCWIDEVWTATLPGYRNLLQVLNRYDFVFVGTGGAVQPLSKAIDKTCHWLPGAVDALKFAPEPDTRRVIDVYSIGRRWNGIHSALLNASERGEMFYIYDTLAAADVETFDPQQHRSLLASVAKRSRFFLVAPPKMDTPEHTSGQVEIGYRYFEGAAAGTVMIGQQPRCQTFCELFPSPDVVTEIAPDGSDVIEQIARLDANPERLSAISRKNVVNSLLGHDWIYRWKKLFDIAGLEPAPGMTRRENRLRNLATFFAHS